MESKRVSNAKMLISIPLLPAGRYSWLRVCILKRERKKKHGNVCVVFGLCYEAPAQMLLISWCGAPRASLKLGVPGKVKAQGSMGKMSLSSCCRMKKRESNTDPLHATDSSAFTSKTVESWQPPLT